MSKRQPGIYFPESVRNIVTLGGEHDHSPPRFREGPSVVVCEDGRCRAELIRKGGVELVERTWYVARDRVSFTIPQHAAGGGVHLHEPHGKDYTVTCDSPDCTAFFSYELFLWKEAKRQGDLWAGVCSESAETRPETVREIEEKAAVFEARVREEAAIERELGRQRRAAILPSLRR
jgi:hypothetical protein